MVGTKTVRLLIIFLVFLNFPIQVMHINTLKKRIEKTMRAGKTGLKFLRDTPRVFLFHVWILLFFSALIITQIKIGILPNIIFIPIFVGIFFLIHHMCLRDSIEEFKTSYIFQRLKKNDFRTAIDLVECCDISPNIRDRFSRYTPLMFASQKGNKRLIETLTAHGGDYLLQDGFGNNALDVAHDFETKKAVIQGTICAERPVLLAQYTAGENAFFKLHSRQIGKKGITHEDKKLISDAITCKYYDLRSKSPLT